jgi:hypothetical protein
MLFAPAVGELLSTSSPPAEFFQPLSLFMLSLLYGGGALLVRETLLRWQRGWLSLVLLGMAYGIAEEGLFCKSFFNPQWMDVGTLGDYGRWLGVNWIWTIHLTAFHTVFSIMVPVTVTNILFPTWRQHRWLPQWLYYTLWVLWWLNGAVMALYFPYTPPVLLYALCFFIVVLLGWLAYRSPAPSRPDVKKRSMSYLSILGWFAFTFAAIFAGFITPLLLPQHQIPAWLTILFLLVIYGFSGWLIMKRVNIHHPSLQAAMNAGALSVLSLIALGAETDPNRVDDPTGLTIVGLVFIGFCIFLLWKPKI